MKKVVNPAICKGWTNSGKQIECQSFCEIRYNDGNLAISGVIGPRRGGNCYGSAGQCQDSIREGMPTEEWNVEMLEKFCDIWDRWHLNDLNPCCEHQRELGWMEQASETLTLYHYKLTSEALKLKNEAEDIALDSLRKGKPFYPTPEQTKYANLKYSIDRYTPLWGEEAILYKPCDGYNSGPEEKRLRGHVRYDEDERGILCKPCPVCGYKYGTAWKKEEVPKEVIDWLFALPETKIQPAWV